MKELEAIQKLADSFTLFPSIGSKTAERMAYAILDMPVDEVNRLIQSISNAKTKVHPCPICGILTEDDVCSICKSESRDHSTCIVLENSKEALSFENGDTYSMKFVAGKPTNVYEGIGSFLSVVESQWGFLFIVLVPCFLIFIYELYALIIEIKYGNEEEE